MKQLEAQYQKDKYYLSIAQRRVEDLAKQLSDAQAELEDAQNSYSNSLKTYNEALGKEIDERVESFSIA